MNDRLLIGTRQESAVMKAGKLRFRKGKEKRVGNAGWQRVVWVGEVLFVRFTVNGRRVPQTKDYPFSHGKA
ncbi:hypothetical protein [Bacteroides fragilis]|uniref:hypothetical protein n=1 Tax=Bacteroides fragilis TaxID=817 RepID=UPI002030752D|nr:hypothetical protein [Bacteroides fragilis]MCM0219038.1 hypothetical protein [Bacteroides fragilis]MCM0267565.1 hypothetical protein [Bacteroides fragilis]